MLDKRIERVNIKFLVKLKKSATETFNLLREAYGVNTSTRAHVPGWHRRFSEGKEDVEDERPGRTVMMKTDEHVEKVSTLVRTVRRLGIRMIEKKLNMEKETRHILTTNLNITESVCQNGPTQSVSI